MAYTHSCPHRPLPTSAYAEFPVIAAPLHVVAASLWLGATCHFTPAHPSLETGHLTLNPEAPVANPDEHSHFTQRHLTSPVGTCHLTWRHLPPNSRQGVSKPTTLATVTQPWWVSWIVLVVYSGHSPLSSPPPSGPQLLILLFLHTHTLVLRVPRHPIPPNPLQC